MGTGVEKMAKKYEVPPQIIEGEEVKNPCLRCYYCNKEVHAQNGCKCQEMRIKMKKIIDDYFDNAHCRDPYDPFSAIINGRDYLLERLFDAIKE